MTTVEELQSMTHEDLVRRVQELEQDLKEVKEQSDMWLDSFTRLQARHESSINALDNIVKLAIIKVTENWAATLRAMKVGDIVVFPVRAISSVNTTISRLRLEMCVENADWKRTGEVDRKRGEFKIQRVS